VNTSYPGFEKHLAAIMKEQTDPQAYVLKTIKHEQAWD
jgi:hypothetical protein